MDNGFPMLLLLYCRVDIVLGNVIPRGGRLSVWGIFSLLHSFDTNTVLLLYEPLKTHSPNGVG
jgi:hypothetical protein